MKKWPDSPYRMLSYYREEDEPLLAGREGDVEECAALLDDDRTKLLLLHGASACGKSSFLRAGLIQHMKEAGAQLTVFVRSTATPIGMLADGVFEMSRTGIKTFHPSGIRETKLEGAVPEELDNAEFRRACASNPAKLMDTLRKLSRSSPSAPILVVDQGEEVLTVDPTPSGDQVRKQFFEFLASYLRAQLDFKLIIALRTEFLGRFVARMRRTTRVGITEFLLDELNESQILEAIERPTLREPVGGMPAPFGVYRFSYAPGLANDIAADLAGASLVGGRLPALQIVCGTLWDRVKESPREITTGDYRAVGGITGAIAQFLNDAFDRCTGAQQLIPAAAAIEVARWKNAMFNLVREQPDGTVTTDLRPVAEFKSWLKGSMLNWDALASLTADGILREVEVLDKETGELVPCLGLGHDALGLVLREWKSRQKRVPAAVTDDAAEALPAGYTLCLSAGGYRAMLFHVGALVRLNEAGLLKKLSAVSSTSAGAIVAGVLAMNWNQLKFGVDGSARNFWDQVAKPLLKLAGTTLESSGITLGVRLILGASRESVEDPLRWELFKDMRLRDLPPTPAVLFSAANLQTRSQVRMWSNRITDARIGTIPDPDWRLSQAVAASLAVPPLLGPCTVKTNPASWKKSSTADLHCPPYTEKLTLVDGALLDYLAVDAVWRQSNPILVSDASIDAEPGAAESGGIAEALKQMQYIIELYSDQLLKLRRSQAIGAIESGSRPGAYWRLCPTGEEWPENLPIIEEGQLTALTQIQSRLRPLDEPVRERLVNLGYARCDACLRSSLLSGLPPAQRLPFPERGWGDSKASVIS
ncbi:MAG: patatin-like phospholipase family protein [Acidobacteria bacterium]|nr:patatin-like phospholipase family protein [Acidobacteriota bacterium]